MWNAYAQLQTNFYGKKLYPGCEVDICFSTVEGLRSQLKSIMTTKLNAQTDLSILKQVIYGFIPPEKCFAPLEKIFGPQIDQIYEQYNTSKSNEPVKRNLKFNQMLFQVKTEIPTYVTAETVILERYNEKLKELKKGKQMNPFMTFSSLQHGKKFLVTGSDFAGGNSEWPLHQMEIEILPGYGELHGSVDYVDPKQTCMMNGTYNPKSNEVMWRFSWYDSGNRDMWYQYNGILKDGMISGTYLGLCGNRNNGTFFYELISVQEPFSKSQLYQYVRRSVGTDVKFTFA